MATAPNISPIPVREPFPSLETTVINGISAFWSAPDGVIERIEEAHALLTMIAAAHQVLHEAPIDAGDSLQTLNNLVKKRAFEGIATLLAVAQHQLDVVAVERAAVRS